MNQVCNEAIAETSGMQAAMKVAFYAPFKPLDHPRPSGDLTTALGLTAFLRARGHAIEVASRLRTRHLASRPWLWPRALPQALLEYRTALGLTADIWLTHHTYYKSPDLLGPSVARALGIPYAVFQGIYSTKRRRDPRTWLGFWLNRRALLAARVVFSNRLEDMANLRRLLPEERLCYVAPGIDPAPFARDQVARARLRAEWGVEGRPVILAVAMFRDDVKSQGLRYLISRLGGMAARHDFTLVLAGDGPTRRELEALARAHLSGTGRVLFLGQVSREDLGAVYSAADLFVFPGIRETLGMVYLEAQAAGLPVVAFANGGIAEVVRQGETGFLTPAFDDQAFCQAVSTLLADPARREAMGRAAAAYVREHHDAERNFAVVEERLLHLVRGGQ